MLLSPIDVLVIQVTGGVGYIAVTGGGSEEIRRATVLACTRVVRSSRVAAGAQKKREDAVAPQWPAPRRAAAPSCFVGDGSEAAGEAEHCKTRVW